jgi:hypothetical protein
VITNTRIYYIFFSFPRFSIVTEEDADRVWTSVENAIELMAEEEDSGED